jgi:hypothetical protein
MWFRSGQAMEIATAPIGDSEKNSAKTAPRLRSYSFVV